MRRMTRKNLRNIQCIFEEKTGVGLNPAHKMQTKPVSKALVIALTILCSLVLAAFTYPLFSSLDGDELSLSASYEGNGIVSIRVENRSDKKLKFQKQTKLMRWVTGEELPRLDGEAAFENTEFEPHSSGIMTIDLSGAYDVQTLEESRTHDEWFYLLLTNNHFLFGQDWMCSVNFAPDMAQTEPESAEQKNLPSTPVEPEIKEDIEEELRFYFEDAYGDTLMAFNGANFQYQQKVEEILTRFDGMVVPALGPVLMVGGPSELLEPEPMMGKPEGVIFDETIPEDQQYLLTGTSWTYTDAYGRMVASVDEKAWVQTTTLPQYQGQTDGGVELPLIFLFVYNADMAKPENYAFIYGQLHSFEELEEHKILEDEYYAIFDATSLIYTDLDAYLDYFLATREDVYCDEQIRQRVHNIYNFYQSKENIQSMYGYLEFSES